jgi:outer membrane protein TolC
MATESNPDLAKMRAMVEMAVASVDVARQTGRPNFAVGGMVDLKASPVMVRPTASISLPIWREKIAATVAAAEARRDAAAARVNAEQLNLAAELAQMLYMVREADRMLAYIDGTALPNFERSYATLEAGVQSGMTGAAMIAETRLMAIDLRHERLELLRQRETAAVDLALLTANVAPSIAPFIAESP